VRFDIHFTVIACQRPPRAVAIPRALRAAAIARSDVAPVRSVGIGELARSSQPIAGTSSGPKLVQLMVFSPEGIADPELLAIPGIPTGVASYRKSTAGHSSSGVVCGKAFPACRLRLSSTAVR
jgi:hypothetical protein